MSGHLAAAWGYYDPNKNAFDPVAMASAGIPDKLIPKDVARYEIGEFVGRVISYEPFTAFGYT